MEEIKRTYYIKGLTVVLYSYAKQNKIDADWEVCEQIAKFYTWGIRHDQENIDEYIDWSIRVEAKQWNILDYLEDKRTLNKIKKLLAERKQINKED